MPYLEFDLNLPNHPKTAYAARLAGICVPQLIGHLTCLWAWAIDYAPDGDLSSYPPEVVESALQWTGEPGKLIAALVNCRFGPKFGFLEETDADAGYLIHDWWQHAGKLIEKRWTDAERKRELRGEKPGPDVAPAPVSDGHPMDVATTSDGHPMDVATTSDGRRNIPDRTKPDQTKPNQTKTHPTRPKKGGGGGVKTGGEGAQPPGPGTVQAILTDPDVGMAPERAQQFAGLPVETVLGHVLAWQREGQAGTVGLGALHWRLKNRPNAPVLRDEDRIAPLYVRHIFGGDQAAAEVAANKLRYLTPGVLH